MLACLLPFYSFCGIIVLLRCQLWNVVRWVLTLLLFFLVGRKPLPSCELVFTASEEAIFVHVLVRRKCVEHLVRHSWFWLDCSRVSLTLNKVFTLCCCVRQWTLQMCQVEIYYLFLISLGLMGIFCPVIHMLKLKSCCCCAGEYDSCQSLICKWRLPSKGQMCHRLTTVLQVLSQALYPVCFFTAWEGNEVALVEEISKLHFTWAPMSSLLRDLWRVLTQDMDAGLLQLW